MLSILQKCAQLWQNLLFASVGALELSKYYSYYKVQWYWDSQGYPRMQEFRTHLDNLGVHDFGGGTYQSMGIYSGTDNMKSPVKNQQSIHA